MNLAWISLAALAIAVTLSMVSKVNVGVVSLAFAWIVGVYLGAMPLNTVIGTFPVQLFLTLAGVTLLFGMANVNGTLERLAARAVRLCRGNAGIIPIMFFVVALGLSTIGPGNIATTAILAPMAMAVGARAMVPPFLTALMVGNGAQAGALSPFAPTGVIVNGIMDRIGLAGHQWQTFGNNLFAHAIVTFTAYFAFGGLRLFTNRPQPAQVAQSDQAGATGGDRDRRRRTVWLGPLGHARDPDRARARGRVLRDERRHGGAHRRGDPLVHAAPATRKRRFGGCRGAS